ncbi:glutamine amidotransferase class-i family protein [Stylonychia lemnae]|uniref:Glutamine amidotransferase class-i family protein n=1 Tax=Stylonychia lemnae TaxID=5949 RepID=A0A078A177_STYLE|nr:glutamine amidotransferase class-i family protein [Stylonychia lemnae]|eukprot:CDW74539.1 glutamine amidotransferase class-i family protein [Stylonychia lemnae]
METDNQSQEFYLNQSMINFLNQWCFRSNSNKNFPEEQYILETNQLFIEDSGGVTAVPIYYDITDRDLYSLLERVNGVHFTGGGLNLIDKETGEEHNKKIGMGLTFLSLAFAKDLNCLDYQQHMVKKVYSKILALGTKREKLFSKTKNLSIQQRCLKILTFLS